MSASTLEKQVKKLLKNNERLRDFYAVGPVQRAAVEQLVESVVQECLKITKPDPGNGPYGDSEDYALQCVQRDIKELFGVE